MRTSSLIGHVAELLDSILRLHKPADNTVRGFFRNRHYLGSNDRRFISESIFGILRNYKLLHVILDLAEEENNLPPFRNRCLPLYAAYAIRIDRTTPDEVAQVMCGLWNIVHSEVECRMFLDRLTSVRLPDRIMENPLFRIAVEQSFPERIVEEWIDTYGAEETEVLCEALNKPAPVTIRVNTLKTSVEECQSALAEDGIENAPTSLSPVGLRLTRRVNVQSLRSFRNGLFEMQDEGSQLLSMLLEPQAHELLIDACAGGGGKTLHIGALCGNDCRIVAMDNDDRRLRNIHRRIERAGLRGVLVEFPGEKNLHEYYKRADKVLIDAPCTGVGVFRRNPAAKLTFTEDFLDTVSGTQRRVLSMYSTLVRGGGRLVYSTCTLLRKENEDAIDWFLREHPDFFPLDAPEILRRQGIPIEAESPFLRFLPHRTGTDGFFAAVLERQADPFSVPAA